MSIDAAAQTAHTSHTFRPRGSGAFRPHTPNPYVAMQAYNARMQSFASGTRFNSPWRWVDRLTFVSTVNATAQFVPFVMHGCTQSIMATCLPPAKTFACWPFSPVQLAADTCSVLLIIHASHFVQPWDDSANSVGSLTHRSCR